jgi:hypothetical protein
MVVFILVCAVFYTYLGAGLALAFAARVASVQHREVMLHTSDLISRQATNPTIQAV